MRCACRFKVFATIFLLPKQWKCRKHIKIYNIYVAHVYFSWAPLLILISFTPCMDNYLHPLWNLGKIIICSKNPTFCWVCDDLYLAGIKISHASKRGPQRSITSKAMSLTKFHVTCVCIIQTRMVYGPNIRVSHSRRPRLYSLPDMKQRYMYRGIHHSKDFILLPRGHYKM